MTFNISQALPVFSCFHLPNNYQDELSECLSSPPSYFENSFSSNIFNQLIKLGIFDRSLNFHQPDCLLCQPLPELKTEQLYRLGAIFNRPIEVNGRESDQEFTLAGLFHWLFCHYPEIKNLQLAGSEVYRILGKEWLKRYCEALNILDLYDSLPKEIFEGQSSDIDLHINVPDTEKKFLSNIGHNTAVFLLGKELENNELKRFFSKLDPFDNGFSRGFNLSFGGPSGKEFDLTFISQIQRSHIFDHDCLTITFTKDSLLNLSFNSSSVFVEGKVLSGWSAPLFKMVKILHTANANAIDLSGAAVLFSYYTKGWICPSSELEKKLVGKIVSVLLDPIRKVNALNKLKKAMQNHLPSPSKAEAAFCFNVCALLCKHGQQELIENNSVTSELLFSKQESIDNFHDCLRVILVSQKVPFSLLYAYLTVHAHLLSYRKKFYHQHGRMEAPFFDCESKSLLQLQISERNTKHFLLLSTDFVSQLKFLLANMNQFNLCKKLDHFFLEGITSHISSPNNFEYEMEILFLAKKCLEYHCLKIIGYAVLCQGGNTQILDIQILVNTLIELLTENKNIEYQKNIVSLFLLFCQGKLGCQVPKEDAENLINFCKDGTTSQIFNIYKYLILIPHEGVQLAIFNCWKSQQEGGKGKKIFLKIGEMLFQKSLQCSLESSLGILSTLLEVKGSSLESLWGYYHQVSDLASKLSLGSQAANILIKLNKITLLLLGRSNKKIDNLKTEQLLWLIDQLYPLFTVEALNLMETIEKLEFLIDYREQKQKLWLKICLAVFSEDSLVLNERKKLEILGYLLKGELNEEEKSFFLVQYEHASEGLTTLNEAIRIFRSQFGEHILFEMITKINHFPLNILEDQIVLLPFLEFLSKKKESLDLALKHAYKILESCPSNKKNEIFKYYQNAKASISFILKRLAKEREDNEDFLKLISHKKLSLLLSNKELSIEWGVLFQSLLEKTKIDFSKDAICSYISFFVTYGSKLANSDITQKNHMYQVGTLLPHLYSKFDNKKFEEMANLLFNKFGFAHFNILTQAAKPNNSLDQILSDFKIKKGNSLNSIKTEDKERFFPLIEGLLDSLLNTKIADLPHQIFISENFCSLLGTLIFLYPEKDERIYELIHQFAFISLPHSDVGVNAHILIIEDIFKTASSKIKIKLSTQKLFELNILLLNEFPKETKQNAASLRDGLIAVVNRLAESQNCFLIERAFSILWLAPPSCFKNHFTLIKECYLNLFSTVKKIEIPSFGDSMGSLIFKLAKSYPTPLNHEFVTTLIELFNEFFDYFLEIKDNFPEIDYLPCCQILDRTILMIEELPAMKGETEVKFQFLNRYLQFSIKAARDNLAINLLPLFQILERIYKNNPEGMKLLASSVQTWVEMLDQIPKERLAKHIRTSALYRTLVK